jgi:hypothetical protein
VVLPLARAEQSQRQCQLYHPALQALADEPLPRSITTFYL